MPTALSYLSFYVPVTIRVSHLFHCLLGFEFGFVVFLVAAVSFLFSFLIFTGLFYLVRFSCFVFVWMEVNGSLAFKG